MVLAVLFISSLALSQWGVYNKPVEVFFLLFTRRSELEIGSFCALGFDAVGFKLKPGDIVFVASMVETTSKMGADVFAATVKTTLSHIKNKKAVPVLVLNAPNF